MIEEGKSNLIKPTLHELPPIKERWTYIYLEHCRISRSNGAFTVKDANGVVYIPSAVISVLLFGPGVDISAKAIALISDSAITAIWVGEHGVRYYAHGRALSSHTRYLEMQARLFSNTRKHLDVVRKMYEMRFEGESTKSLTLQQLRGREGSRMRHIYANEAKKWNIEWHGRNYDPNDFNSSDTVNKALSAGNVCLYGIATAVITSLGCSPGLGFIHVGHELSFAYDIADLYKAEFTIPLAFELASKNVDNIESVVRHSLRDMFAQSHLIERMVRDIKYIFEVEEDAPQEPLYLWDNLKEHTEYGILYEERIVDDSSNIDQ